MRGLTPMNNQYQANREKLLPKYVESEPFQPNYYITPLVAVTVLMFVLIALWRIRKK